MMIYAYVEVTISEPGKFAQYAEQAGAALAKHNGTAMNVSKNPHLLEGSDTPERAVILSFPDKDSALGWINDPELQSIHALRRGAGQSRIVLLA